jgi:hypothetical protein
LKGKLLTIKLRLFISNHRSLRFEHMSLKLYPYDHWVIRRYSGTCLIWHTKGPGKCVRLYRMSECWDFIFENKNIAPLQWNLCNPTPAFSDFLWHPTKIYGPKVYLLTKIKSQHSDILYLPVQSMPFTTNVVSSNPAQVRCTRYNIIHQ